jgi:sugar phosphate isomerase/epimerase
VRSLALAHLSAIDLPPGELIDAAAVAGFDAVTLRLLPAGPRERLSPLVTDPVCLRDTVARLHDRGVGVLDVEALRLRATVSRDDLMPALEAAAALGAHHLLVVGDEPDAGRLADALHSVAELAAPLDVRPVLEFVPFTAVSTLAIAVSVVRAAGHPAAGVLVDPLHLCRSGGVPADVARVAAVRQDLLPYAQLCDAPLAAAPDGMRGLYREAVRDRRLPGEGELPLRELLATLPPAIPLSVEIPMRALSGLPAAERASRIARAVRTWLDAEP